MKKLTVKRVKIKNKGRVYTPADLMSDPLSPDGETRSYWCYMEEVVFDVNEQRQRPEERSIKPIPEFKTGTGWPEERES